MTVKSQWLGYGWVRVRVWDAGAESRMSRSGYTEKRKPEFVIQHPKLNPLSRIGLWVKGYDVRIG